MYKKIGILALILSSAVYAEEIQSTKLNESVISTENFETSVRDTAANISIVTAQEIEKTGAKDLVDALKNVPGIFVKNYAGGIKFDIRGLNSMYSDRNALITLDGVPVTSTQVSNIPIETIERIEVIPGGGGILYGDKAIGGIVNIISKSAIDKKNYGTVYSHFGSNSEHKIGFNYGTKLTQRFITEVGYTDYDSDGWRRGENFDKKEGRFKAKYLLDNGDIEFKYNHSDNKTYKGIAVPSYILDNDRRNPGSLSKSKNKSNDYYLKWKQNISEDTEFLIYGNYYENKKWLFNKTKDSFYRDGDEVRKYVKAQIKHTYLPDSYFIAGIDILKDEVKPYDTSSKFDASLGRYVKSGDSTKDGFGIFALNKYSVGKFQFTQGIRYDYADYEFYWRNASLNAPDKRGTKDNAKYNDYSFELSANYLYSETGSTYLTYTRAFRTPTASEIYYTRNSERLDPQVQDTIELGVKDFFANTYISASTFYKMTHDEIYSTIPPEFIGMVNYNIGNSERIGAEIYAEHYIGDLTLKSSITYLHHKVISGKYSGSEIPSVPNWKVTFGAGYDFNSNFSVGADAIYAGNTYDLDDIANERKEDTGEYFTVDVFSQYKFNNGISLTFRINNIFDEKYNEYAGFWDDSIYHIDQRHYYPAIGRTYTAGISYSF